MSEEQANPDHLLVEHRLDLSLAADRAALVADNASHPKAALLGELDSYLSYFPAPELRTIYGGGIVTFGHHGYQILGLLEVATQLDAMAHYPGFAELIAGFRNRTQFRSTIYEVSIASWCLARKPTRGIQFAPVVQTKRGLKKPDFLWETTLGSPYVECKQASSSENGMTKRLNRLFGVATKEYGLRPIDDDSVRLDLAVGQISNGVEQRVRQVVRQLCAVWQLGQPIQLGEITGVVRPRVALLPGTSEVLRTFQMTLSTAPTKIDIENAQLSLVRIPVIADTCSGLTRTELWPKADAVTAESGRSRDWSCLWSSVVKWPGIAGPPNRLGRAGGSGRGVPLA